MKQRSLRRIVGLKELIVALCFIVLGAGGAEARRQNTTRPRLSSTSTTKEDAQHACDSIFPVNTDVAISGYEKTLKSRKETMFVTNNSGYHISGLCLTISYFDDKGRQLHQREAKISCDIPNTETRMIDIPAWDKQGVWYYKKSAPGGRTSSSASPYDVKVNVDYAIVELPLTQ